MNSIHINCSKIDGPREFHWTLQQSLRFPAWYGNNLDALYECLTAIHIETHLHFHHWDHMEGFSLPFRRCLEDACRDNPLLLVTISILPEDPA